MAERLSGMDSSFVALESATMPQHVMGVLVLDASGIDGGLSFDLFRRILQERIHLMKPLRRRLVEVPLGLDHPRFVEDPDFDLDAHLEEVTLPAPGGQRELEVFVGSVAGPVLDRSRPLWRMWVVQGLADGRAAIVTKMHHATMDGVTGADLMAHLFDLSPEPRTIEEPATEHVGEATPSGWRMAVDGIVRQATSPPKVLAQAARSTVNMASAARTAVARRRATTLPMTAPKVRWSGALSDQRAVAFAQVSLDDLKTIRAAHGVKVNDVILAIVTQALRGYLDGLGELPDSTLVASVPVSVRAEGDDRTNQIATMLAPLPVHLADPVEQLAHIGQATAASKELTSAMGNDLITGWSDLTSPAMLSLFAGMYTRLRLGNLHPPIHNAVVSNVQGPPLELWVAGGRVEAVYPMGPLLPGAGINVTCLSNMGNVDVGILVDGATVPEPWRIAEALPDAVATLLATC
jgi:diacylglycerol O-acyltransferase / wax synthase